MTSSQMFPNEHVSAATHSVYLALGANIGNRRDNLVAALQHLRKFMEIDSISSLYETEPVGYIDQPRFFNLVCHGKTWLKPEDLLKYVKEIEVVIGRKPSFRNGPRPIDIDIIFYENIILQQDHLAIPHPRMRERAFVLAPLTEIAPDSIDPISGKNVAELLATLSQEGVNRLAPDQNISLERDILLLKEE